MVSSIISSWICWISSPEPLPLARDQMSQLFVEVPDFEFGFEIDAVVVLGPQTILRFLRRWLIMMIGACTAVRQDRQRLSRMNG